jgi:hypothetical protein
MNKECVLAMLEKRLSSKTRIVKLNLSTSHSKYQSVIQGIAEDGREICCVCVPIDEKATHISTSTIFTEVQKVL